MPAKPISIIIHVETSGTAPGEPVSKVVNPVTVAFRKISGPPEVGISFRKLIVVVPGLAKKEFECCKVKKSDGEKKICA